jgi:hypothetical protein
MARTPDPKSLPKWAQEKIEYLERDLAQARERLRKRFENAPTALVINRYGDTAAFLNENDLIAFHFGEEFIEFRFERDSEHKPIGVNVYASTFATDSLGFFPSSGNTGRLMLARTRS